MLSRSVGLRRMQSESGQRRNGSAFAADGQNRSVNGGAQGRGEVGLALLPLKRIWQEDGVDTFVGDGLWGQARFRNSSLAKAGHVLRYNPPCPTLIAADNNPPQRGGSQLRFPHLPPEASVDEVAFVHGYGYGVL